jgi:succinyl-diaminopimelate desuccinylase
MDIKTLLETLVRFPSITPKDASCQEWMMGFLNSIGFSCQKMNKDPVSNFFALYGRGEPLLVFAGHSDVVPVGHIEQWQSDPFVLKEHGDLLYGRGVADMKGSLAAMLHMAARFVKDFPEFRGRLGFLITSGEEGDDFDKGTPHVMEILHGQGIHIDYCVIGEPSSTETLGDVIKIGRRGSLTAQLKLEGKQGHVAYPHLAINPIHQLAPALAELCGTIWDAGNSYFPPTTMQITMLQSGGHASNIIPGELMLQLNFRFSTEQTEAGLKERVMALFERHQLKPSIKWRLNGLPFLTAKGQLVEQCQQAILEITRQKPILSTSGGTSDGRFIAPYGVEVIELGPVNASIHQVNEWVSLTDLQHLEAIYYNIAKRVFQL